MCSYSPVSLVQSSIWSRQKLHCKQLRSVIFRIIEYVVSKIFLKENINLLAIVMFSTMFTLGIKF